MAIVTLLTDSGKSDHYAAAIKAAVLKVNPAATEKSVDGIHRGDNAGRACWIIAGTYCGGEIQGSYAAKTENCSKCDFFKLVMEEEKMSLHDATHLLQALSIVSR
jgi:hypothetical protein